MKQFLQKLRGFGRQELLLITISTGLFFVFLYWHLVVGISRYIDVDEYAHLHWAAQTFAGKRPYIDFLSFFTPGYWWFLAPIFWMWWGSITTFTAGRVLAFIIFAGICLFSGLIFWQLRKSLWGAIFACALLAFLPLPFDKYLEIRPDSLATLLLLIGIWLQVRFMAISVNPRDQFGSGLMYGLSLIVLVKMLPSVAVSVIIATVWGIGEIGEIRGIKTFKNKKWWGDLLKKLKFFIAGMITPLGLFALWLLSLGNLPLVWYSMTKLPFEANRISEWFFMGPSLFFNPNNIFYGEGGWSQGLIVNHIIWVAGIVWGAYRLMTPYLTNLYNFQFSIFNFQSKKNFVLAEVLVGLQLFVQIIFYVQFAPLKHAQYLIPIGVFIAWYGADIIWQLWQKCQVNRYTKSIFVFAFIVLSVFLYQTFNLVTKPKANWNNTREFTQLKYLYNKITQNEYVFDLDGRMLYNPDSYYACCIPFGQFSGYLTKPLPSLSEALIKTNTKYINQGELQRVNTLPMADQQYIYQNFRSVSGDNVIMVRNDQVDF